MSWFDILMLAVAVVLISIALTGLATLVILIA